MFLILSIMFCGVALGSLMRGRRFPIRMVGHLILPVICLLLFCMGFSVGSNREVIENFPALGLEAFVIAAGALLGSLFGAKIVYSRFFGEKGQGMETIDDNDAEKAVKSGGSGDSLKIVLSFLFGILVGVVVVYVAAEPEGSTVLPFLTRLADRGSVWVLYLLMFLVGISVGDEGDILRRLRTGGLKILWVPVATVLGTWVGVALLSPCVGDRTLTQCLMVGSGFGYYSLSSILISQSSGVALGTISLISNILRELVALTLAPVLVRLFGPLAPICAGGATTMDTTLPVIAQFSGKNFIFVAIIHGIVVDFSVPVSVTFFSLL